MKIGFFDSGLGGLTILRAVRQFLPQYDYVFYGDTENVPFGEKTAEEIYALTEDATRYLFEEHDVALMIVACNTASTQTLRKLQDTFLKESYPERRILGVIVPTIEEVIASGRKHALLVGTRRTIESKKYDLELESRNITHLILESEATPGLVPLIETGETDSAYELLYETIAPRLREIDALILGCTHYVVLTKRLRESCGESCTVFSQDEIIPQKLAEYLIRHSDLEKKLSQDGTQTIQVTKSRVEYEDGYTDNPHGA